MFKKIFLSILVIIGITTSVVWYANRNLVHCIRGAGSVSEEMRNNQPKEVLNRYQKWHNACNAELVKNKDGCPYYTDIHCRLIDDAAVATAVYGTLIKETYGKNKEYEKVYKETYNNVKPYESRCKNAAVAKRFLTKSYQKN